MQANRQEPLNIDIIDKSWLPEDVVLLLFSKASQQFKDETYDINKCMRETICYLELKSPQDEAREACSQKFSKQIFHFCALLGEFPKYFIQLLNEEIITSHSHIITLNSRNERVAKRFFKDFFKFNEQATELPKYFSNEKLQKEMYYFINVVAKKICKIYDECCTILKKDIEQLTQKIKKSKIMNNYVLYKVFREISQSMKLVVEEKCTETVFRNCPVQVIHNFYNYIINKFEIVKLFVNQDIFHSMFEPSPVVFFGNFEKNDKIDLLPKEAVNSEGKFAIFVKTFSEDPQIQRTLEDYLLILDQQLKLRVINCKTLRKQWYIMNDLQTDLKLTIMAKDYILEGQESIDALLKAKPEPIVNIINCEPLQSFTNFNGVIGRCLFLMNKYTGVSHFFKDLSKRAVLTRSMEQIMYQIPIVGYMIFAGTFSVSFYKIFSNKFSTDTKKMKQFGSFMFGTTATVGTSILGAITGQILIPIPIVGALIGSVIGGFIGNQSSKQVNSWIQKKKFLETINYLQKSQIDQQYWLCTNEFYRTLEIRQKQFNKYVPSYMQDYVFATLIGFVLVCFYQSKRLNDYNLQRTKNLPQIKQEPGFLGGYGRKKQKQFEDEIKKLSYEEEFQTQFNIMKMVDFLQANNASLYEHYDTLETSILTNLSKIIN